jgi:hypothetical protein
MISVFLEYLETIWVTNYRIWDEEKFVAASLTLFDAELLSRLASHHHVICTAAQKAFFGYPSKAPPRRGNIWSSARAQCHLRPDGTFAARNIIGYLHALPSPLSSTKLA